MNTFWYNWTQKLWSKFNTSVNIWCRNFNKYHQRKKRCLSPREGIPTIMLWTTGELNWKGFVNWISWSYELWKKARQWKERERELNDSLWVMKIIITVTKTDDFLWKYNSILSINKIVQCFYFSLLFEDISKLQTSPHIIRKWDSHFLLLWTENSYISISNFSIN